jgi:hypothetical protein
VRTPAASRPAPARRPLRCRRVFESSFMGTFPKFWPPG